MGFLTEIKETIRDFGLEWFNRYYSCYKGFIVDNNDPDQLGRVRVRVPDLFGQQVLETWALPKGMFSGKSIGFFAIPKPGDTVWVSFQGGDSRFPVWEYGWYSKDTVPESARRDDPNNYVFRTPNGQTIEYDDESNSILIKNKEGFIIELTESGIKIEKGSVNLGDLLVGMNEDIAQLTVGTAFGPSTIPVNAISFTQAVIELQKLLS